MAAPNSELANEVSNQIQSLKQYGEAIQSTAQTLKERAAPAILKYKEEVRAKLEKATPETLEALKQSKVGSLSDLSDVTPEAYQYMTQAYSWLTVCFFAFTVAFHLGSFFGPVLDLFVGKVLVFITVFFALPCYFGFSKSDKNSAFLAALSLGLGVGCWWSGRTLGFWFVQEFLANLGILLTVGVMRFPQKVQFLGSVTGVLALLYLLSGLIFGMSVRYCLSSVLHIGLALIDVQDTLSVQKSENAHDVASCQTGSVVIYSYIAHLVYLFLSISKNAPAA